MFDKWLHTARIMESLSAVQSILIQVNTKAGSTHKPQSWKEFHPMVAKAKPDGLLNPKTMSSILWSIGNQMISVKGH